MLRIEGLTVGFSGITVIAGLDLAMTTDEIVGLVGPNGAGKTTLFNAISGLVRPWRGSIAFEGADLVGAPLHRRARIGLGRTFQIPQPLHELTVRENLVVAQRCARGRVDAAKIEEILDFTGLARKANALAAEDLVLTELKALEVAKALATEPKLLLLDEVLAGLETNAKRRFTGLLADLHARFGVGILMIEHDLETMARLCPRVVVLDYGRLIADGPPEAVFRDPAVVASYTGGGHVGH